ncbi:MAG: hypothetical protein KGI50_05740 [Patescibacteria group bacterium]|nr:hypothetical protein [Patescibacteria group bacterium]MDE1971045.1 hypothetical protein [Patescibacteria group bacterium]
MFSKPEGTISIIAALLVLFSAMLNPMVSVVLAVVALVGLGIYEFMKKPNAAMPTAETKNKQTENKEQEKKALLDFMESGNQPLTNEHVRMMLGISEATATRYFDELEKEGKIRQVGKEGAHVFYEKI